MNTQVSWNKMTDKEFNDETSHVIWNKLKGQDVPDHYTDKDKKEIVERYWHRAMESEQ